MASSIPALAASLNNVAARLRRMCGQSGTDDAAKVIYRDLEDADEIPELPQETTAVADESAVRAELARVESFIARAKSLPHDAKARSFQDAIRVLLNVSANGDSGKAVVFTESITTQEYLRTLLLGMGLRDQEVTLFRGVNDHDRAQEAYTRWQKEEGSRFAKGTRPSREVAIRLALVHEFRTRSRILICTEAGAKGLNLQFCNTVINYDLPWNPQRIEQRIGRCHRYSQEHDVTVVNFIARDNEAHRLTFEILSQKLDLFGKVLDASDTVLHEPRTDAPELVVSALSVELETDLRNIYSRSRTLDEVTREIAALRDKIAERRAVYEREYQRTSQIIESRFDENVRKVFRNLREELPHGLAELDKDVADLVEGYLAASSIKYQRVDEPGGAVFDIASDAKLPAEIGEGRRFATGDARSLDNAEALNLVHPLVRAAIIDSRTWIGGSVIFEVPSTAPSDSLVPSTGVGHLRVALVDYSGFEPVQRLVAAAVIDGNAIDPMIAKRLIHLRAREGPKHSAIVDPELLNDALEEAVFVDQREIEQSEQKHFEQAIRQLERFVEDKILVLRRERSSISQRLRSARERRDQLVGSTARERVEAEIEELATREDNLERRIGALESREDEVYKKWRDHYHKLRYQPPNVQVLFDATLKISPLKPGMSC